MSEGETMALMNGGLTDLSRSVQVRRMPAAFRDQGVVFGRKGVRSARGGGVAAIGPRPSGAKGVRQWIRPGWHPLWKRVKDGGEGADAAVELPRQRIDRSFD